jgi:hypothetical protein
MTMALEVRTGGVKSFFSLMAGENKIYAYGFTYNLLPFSFRGIWITNRERIPERELYVMLTNCMFHSIIMQLGKECHYFQFPLCME